MVLIGPAVGPLSVNSMTVIITDNISVTINMCDYKEKVEVRRTSDEEDGWRQTDEGDTERKPTWLEITGRSEVREDWRSIDVMRWKENPLTVYDAEEVPNTKNLLGRSQMDGLTPDADHGSREDE